jgi:hypothetical protein
MNEPPCNSLRPNGHRGKFFHVRHDTVQLDTIIRISIEIVHKVDLGVYRNAVRRAYDLQ